MQANKYVALADILPPKIVEALQQYYRNIIKTKYKVCVLQCGVVCCSVLQCVVLCCRVLRCVAVWCSVLQYVAIVLQCVAVCGSVLQCVAELQDYYSES